jgi:hypothetical protein
MKVKKWHLYVVGAVIVLVVFFLAGKQLAAILGGGLAFLGIGKGAIDKKRKKIVDEAEDEEKVMDKVKEDIKKRKEKEKELKENDIKNVETAEKLEKKDKELDEKAQNLRDRLSEHTKE